MDIAPEIIDCACVIHGNAYSWTYVDRLHSMLSRHLTPKVRLHVYTESDRSVPAQMIKHVLTEWPISRPGRGWWYKMQLFNPAHHGGALLYFDLDTVVVNNIDWIWQQSTKYFWAIRDFKYLWRPDYAGLNSSVMWWDTINYQYVWDSIDQQDLAQVMLKYRGDQDYITDVVPENQRRLFDTEQVKSWRWQCLDGGYNFEKKRHLKSNTGTQFNNNTSILIFHGNPKPDQVADPVILQHWQ